MCFLVKEKGVDIAKITSEKELHGKDGFNVRKHRPDFIVENQNGVYAVEVEMTLKSKGRFHNIVKDNYMNYKGQIWVVPDRERGIRNLLEEWKSLYTGIGIYSLKDVKIEKP